jgi:K+-sensing histidine kinase KdpD
MAFCNSEEFTVAKVGNSFCNFVLFHYATNTFKRRGFTLIPYLFSIVMIIFTSLVIILISYFFGTVNISMLFLLPVLLSAARWGRVPAMITA